MIKPLTFFSRWKNLSQLLERLTRPSEALQAQEDRQAVRILISESLAMLVAALFIIPIWIYTSPNFPAAKLIGPGFMLLLLISYRAARTRAFRVGAALLVVSILALVITTLVFAPGPAIERMLILPFLVLCVIP